MNTQDYDLALLYDPQLPAAELARIAQVRPDLWGQMLSHPQMYPELAAWITSQQVAAAPQPQPEVTGPVTTPVYETTVGDAYAMPTSSENPTVQDSAYVGWDPNMYAQQFGQPTGPTPREAKPRSKKLIYGIIGGVVAAAALIGAGILVFSGGSGDATSWKGTKLTCVANSCVGIQGNDAAIVFNVLDGKMRELEHPFPKGAEVIDSPYPHLPFVAVPSYGTTSLVGTVFDLEDLSANGYEVSVPPNTKQLMQDWNTSDFYALTSDGTVWSNATTDAAEMVVAGFSEGATALASYGSGACALIPTDHGTDIQCRLGTDPIQTLSLDSKLKFIDPLGLVLENGRFVRPIDVTDDSIEFAELKIDGDIEQVGFFEDSYDKLCVLEANGALFCSNDDLYDGGDLQVHQVPMPGNVEALGAGIAMLSNNEVWTVSSSPALVPLPAKARTLIGATWVMTTEGPVFYDPDDADVVTLPQEVSSSSAPASSSPCVGAWKFASVAGGGMTLNVDDPSIPSMFSEMELVLNADGTGLAGFADEVSDLKWTASDGGCIITDLDSNEIVEARVVKGTLIIEEDSDGELIQMKFRRS